MVPRPICVPPLHSARLGPICKALWESDCRIRKLRLISSQIMDCNLTIVARRSYLCRFFLQIPNQLEKLGRRWVISQTSLTFFFLPRFLVLVCAALEGCKASVADAAALAAFCSSRACNLALLLCPPSGNTTCFFLLEEENGTKIVMTITFHESYLRT